MAESEKTNISIAGRMYPLILDKQEIEVARKAELLINETYNRLQLDYKITDKTDCLAMTLITLQLEQQAASPASAEAINEKLSLLESLLNLP